MANMLMPHKESAERLSTAVFNHVMFDFSYEFMIKLAIIISFAVVMNLTFFFLFQPKVVTESDEVELAKQMERLERENAEVDGDDDNPDEEEISEEI